MTIHATFNPIGSTSPKDLIDNAQNLDYLILGPAHSYPDRRAVGRLSWAGIEASFAAAQLDRANRFDAFIESSGYDVIGDYVSQPVTFTERNQLMLKDGELWKPKASVALPYVTTGVWASEAASFVSVGDAALRQELAQTNGGTKVGWIQKGAGAVSRNIDSKLDESPITIEDYLPNIVYVEAPYGQAQINAATIIDDARDKATALARATGRPLRFKAKGYRCTKIWDIPSEINAEGVAVGQYLPTMHQGIAGGSYKPDANGTIFFMTGTGAKNQTALGITDCRTGGGVVANDSIKDPGYDDNYSLSSFYNNDANVTTGQAATPKLFSAAVRLGLGVQGCRLRNFRVMPSFKGIEGYRTGEIGLGDEWDVGLYVDNAAQNYFENVQVVGYWRMQGRLVRVGVTAAENVSGVTRASIEHNIFKGCVFTGQVGSEIRGADTHRVLGVGVDYIDVPWAANHPFNPTTINKRIRALTGPAFDFTGTAVVGGNLRLTGVTPTPAALPLTTSISPVATGNGVAMFTDDNCILSGLDHQSGNRATAAAMGAFRSARPSAALMISGYSLRGYRSPFTKIILQDDVAFQIHYATDIRLGPYLEIESKDANGLGLGARLISSPSETLNTRVPNPSGSVFRLEIDTLRNTSDGTDFRPINAFVPARFPAGNGYLLANQMTVSAIHDNIDNGRFIRPGVGTTAGIKQSNGGRALYYDDATGQCRSEKDLRLDSNNLLNSAGDIKIVTTGAALSLRGDIFNVLTSNGMTSNFRVDSVGWTPNSTDGVVSVGNPAHRMNTVFATTGTINTSDARVKTEVRPFTPDEIAAVKEIIGEIGMYKFLDAIAEKGDAARWHSGLTVQRAIEIFEAYNIDPFQNAFICYDKWDDEYDEWPAEFETVPAVIDHETGVELEPESKVITKEAGKTLNREAGDLYSFRNDQLALAMLAGVAATQRDLEERLCALESR